MKKIGIITVSRTINFGAELQAFALQHKLNSLGYDAEVIDYLYFKNKRHRTRLKSKPELKFGHKEALKNHLLYRIVSPMMDIFMQLFYKSTKNKINNFINFHKHNTSFSSEFVDITSLYDFRHDYDVFITGSDQVWNPATFSSLKPYLLDFVPEGKKRVAYAASFGVSKVNIEYKDLYNKLFRKFDFIGVREESGKKLVKEICGKDSKVVLDPTLLLRKEEWEVVTKNINLDINHSYLLIYDLHYSEPLINLAYQLSKRYNLKIYRLCKRSYKNQVYKEIKNITDAGPSEFIQLFLKASYVVTNSFHGTIFSTNFNIPFYSVLSPKRDNNSRLLDFLNMVNLSDRIIWENESTKEKTEILYMFKDANIILEQKREYSLKQLKSAISE